MRTLSHLAKLTPDERQRLTEAQALIRASIWSLADSREYLRPHVERPSLMVDAEDDEPLRISVTATYPEMPRARQTLALRHLQIELDRHGYETYLRQRSAILELPFLQVARILRQHERERLVDGLLARPGGSGAPQ